jgi:hypothetical protein
MKSRTAQVGGANVGAYEWPPGPNSPAMATEFLPNCRQEIGRDGEPDDRGPALHKSSRAFQDSLQVSACGPESVHAFTQKRISVGRSRSTWSVCGGGLGDRGGGRGGGPAAAGQTAKLVGRKQHGLGLFLFRLLGRVLRISRLSGHGWFPEKEVSFVLYYPMIRTTRIRYNILFRKLPLRKSTKSSRRQKSRGTRQWRSGLIWAIGPVRLPCAIRAA